MDMKSALKLMKSPQNKRRNIWMNGILQIWVTRDCNLACTHCTQGSNLKGKTGRITPEQFEVAVKSLKDYFGVVGMFGGNPAMHPQFDELCKIMRAHIPFHRRGLWCNDLMGKGAHARITFNPNVSNLNVHMSSKAHDEMVRDWPEAARVVKGLDGDSHHAPTMVALKDVISDEGERWELISKCDVNQNWSAMICVVRNELRGFFCEIAGAHAMLHQHEPDYPDLGVPIEPGWWNKPMTAFSEQAKFHCHDCGVPLRAKGDHAVLGKFEQVSKTHQEIYQIKSSVHRTVQVITSRGEMDEQALVRATDYIENGRTVK